LTEGMEKVGQGLISTLFWKSMLGGGKEGAREKSEKKIGAISIKVRSGKTFVVSEEKGEDDLKIAQSMLN